MLGIDPAWTDRNASGVALLRQEGSRWKCVRVAPDYAAFCNGFNWQDPIARAPVDGRKLLAVCRELLDEVSVQVVAGDMPLATNPILGRRKADDEISRRFGHCKCSVHSPTQSRPGAIGRRLHEALIAESFKLATNSGCELPALLEVYPHVALLGLAGKSERLPYKATKTRTYWLDESVELRKKRLCEEWKAILARIREHIDGIDLSLPKAPESLSFDDLKRFEDAIDALVCAWMATQFLDKRAVPLGDNTAAIWIPSCSLQFSK